MEVEEGSLARILLCIIYSLFLGGRCFPPLFLYRPGPLCLLPVYLGFLAPFLFVFNILLSLLIKKKMYTRSCSKKHQLK